MVETKCEKCLGRLSTIIEWHLLSAGFDRKVIKTEVTNKMSLFAESVRGVKFIS